MRVKSRLGQFWIRAPWIALLILGLVRTPLPLPDFHNIRHHDAPGEVCEYHDHLLRWHPGAGAAEDVAILHWHWLVPGSARSDGSPVTPGEAIHAHIPDGLAPAERGPEVAADSSGRDLCRIVSLLSLMPGLPCAGSLGSTLGATPAKPFPSCGATAAPRAPVASLLQRWDC